jgi:hypothetical protein
MGGEVRSEFGGACDTNCWSIEVVFVFVLVRNVCDVGGKFQGCMPIVVRRHFESMS